MTHRQINWSEDEVKALYVVLHGMAAADGEVDRSEIKEVLSHVIKKTGEELFSYNFFIANELVEAAEKVDVKRAVATLSQIEPAKKDLVVDGLRGVMSADGKIKKEEVKYLDKIVALLSNYSK